MNDPTSESIRPAGSGAPRASFWLVALLVPVVLLVSDGWVDIHGSIAIAALAWIAGAVGMLRTEARSQGGLSIARGVLLMLGLALATAIAGALAVLGAIWLAIQL